MCNKYGVELHISECDEIPGEIVYEEAQYFYRKLGYEDCGNLNIVYPGFEQPTELFLSKEL